MKVSFVNAQRMNRLHPNSFFVHSYDELKTIVVGDYVQVCSNKERFWVVVTDVNGKKFKGAVANELICNELELDDEVKFTMTNIYTFVRR